MKALTAAEIRERFLAFFEARGHTRYPSDSLVPSNDKTLLFTGAGMNQFKDMFLGKGGLPFRRAATAQKCLRVPDLENVGATPRHHTFFEMLGNFSFGDYFKKECIRWEWGFFTDELGFPAERLVVTVYRDDDEAFAIWRDEVGLPPERIYRFGEKENFWPAEAPSKGPNGPCGPCSEIYWDRAPGQPLPSNEALTELPDRFVEVGNCVFTQFDRQDDGTLAPLPQKNIDVGLGLERIAAVVAGVETNFETDLFRPYLDFVAKRSGKEYGADARADVRMRRIADHVRAVTFCIADGALPGNEGRGYVVRKILRRAVRDGYELGIEGAFLHELVDVVGEVMGGAYPEVREHAAQCRMLVKSEEESFAGVYRQGMARLHAFLGKAQERGGVLAGSGDFAFQLHDTYGFPVDITRQVLAERGFTLDEPGFEEAMSAQRERARAASATSDAVFERNAAMVLRDAGVAPSGFVGYERLRVETRIAALVGDGENLLPAAGAGARVRVVVADTPCYAQGGGQVGDRGTVRSASGSGRILSTAALDGYWLHDVVVEGGELRTEDACVLEVDEPARRATERNHTATHLLHAALKSRIGPHVSQAGSEVAPDRLRFDYTHGERLSDEEIRALEDEVNAVVMSATAVVAKVRPLAEARSEGFVAMFGERYGAEVRTLSVGDYSRELCGGTHVANTGQIGAFRIVSDSAISAGTRRIEAVTGTSALAEARVDRELVGLLAGLFKVQRGEIAGRVSALLDDHKRLRKELEKALAADVGKVLDELRAAAEPRGASHVVVHVTAGLQMKEVQELLTRAKQAFESFAGVVLVPGDQEILVGAAVTPDLTGCVRAGDLVKQVAGLLGGGGGGRPELAQGKGREPGRAAEAAALARELLSSVGR